MKTVVMGLFDRVDDARRVLTHLASLPLDLDTIQVVHADPAIQRRLADEARLPARRALRNGLVLGGGLGAAIGFMAGSPSLGGALPVISSLGPLLTMAAGTLAGAVLGMLGGVMTESLRLPAEHQDDVIEALGTGATVVMVHTENLPTARALSDLFRDSGSRMLSTADPIGAAGDAPAALFLPPAVPIAGAAPDDSGSTIDAPTTAPADASLVVPDEYLPFAPPWRRADGDVEESSDASVDIPPPPDLAVDALGLPARTARLLQEAGITGLAQLRTLAAGDPGVLLNIHGIGPAALAEIQRVVADTTAAEGSPA